MPASARRVKNSTGVVMVPTLSRIRFTCTPACCFAIRASAIPPVMAAGALSSPPIRENDAIIPVTFPSSPRSGAIVIETARDVPNSLVRVVVADTGPGIPPAERDKLFLPYYSTKGRGSGLGLAIVRRIVAEHGGSIDVFDNLPTGTRFIIELPA